MGKLISSLAARLRGGVLVGRDVGTSTVEYVLLILVAVSIVMLLLQWAASGNMGRIFDAVLSKALSSIK